MLHYVFSLNYIKKTIKTKCNPSYSNYMSNSIFTKKNSLVLVGKKKKKKKKKRKRKNHCLIKHNKINTNNKLKIIKKIIR